MRGKPSDGIDRESVGGSKSAPRRGPRWWIGPLCLGLSILAVAFLVPLGVILLLLAGAMGILDMLAQPDMDRIEGIRESTMIGAGMITGGICLAVGLLRLRARERAGRLGTGWRAIAAALGLSVAVTASAVLAAWLLTAPVPAPASLFGLEGAWYDPTQSSYRFNPDGSVSSWSDGLPHGKVGTWTRAGQTVTLVHVQGWKIVGTLDGNTITGASSLTPSGTYPAPIVLRREVVP